MAGASRRRYGACGRGGRGAPRLLALLPALAPASTIGGTAHRSGAPCHSERSQELVGAGGRAEETFKGGVRAIQAGLDGADARLEHVGQVLVGEVLEVAEHHDRAKLWREAVERLVDL